jgi:hypothetical protein
VFKLCSRDTDIDRGILNLNSTNASVKLSLRFLQSHSLSYTFWIAFQLTSRHSIGNNTADGEILDTLVYLPARSLETSILSVRIGMREKQSVSARPTLRRAEDDGRDRLWSSHWSRGAGASWALRLLQHHVSEFIRHLHRLIINIYSIEIASCTRSIFPLLEQL